MKRRLYPGPEATTLRYQEYDLMVALARGAKSALEFGPGYSTFALIEAGIEKILTLEHDDHWYGVAVEKFKDYPQVVVARYWDEFPVRAEHGEATFDVAFVDSPKGFNKPIPGISGTRKVHPGYEDCSRLNTCLYALERAPVVFLHDANRPLEKGTLGHLWKMGHSFQQFPGKAGIARIIRNGKNKDGFSPQSPQELRCATAGANP